MFKTLRGGQVDLKIVYGFTLFIVAQTLAWYQLNSQFVWKFWEGKAILSAIIFSVPVSLFFWFGTKNIYDSAEALWTCRFLGFTSGIFVFTILTWLHLNESMFTLKTMLCLILSCAILAIQVFMK